MEKPYHPKSTLASGWSLATTSVSFPFLIFLLHFPQKGDSYSKKLNSKKHDENLSKPNMPQCFLFAMFLNSGNNNTT